MSDAYIFPAMTMRRVMGAYCPKHGANPGHAYLLRYPGYPIRYDYCRGCLEEELAKIQSGQTPPPVKEE